jgi:hypothetical protein
MSQRWLTATELAIELGIDHETVLALHKQGKIAGIGTNAATMRYLDPGPELARQTQQKRLEYFPVITTRELAEILGISQGQVRKDAAYGVIEATEIVPNGRGKRAFYDVATVRKILAEREKRRGPGRKTYSTILIKWVRGWLMSQKTQVQVLDELIRKVAAQVPDPEKTAMIKELWDLFDRVNEILEVCDRWPYLAAAKSE